MALAALSAMELRDLTHELLREFAEPARSRAQNLLRRTYAIEVLVCDPCGARRESIACLTAPDSIRRTKEHLGLPTRPPPIRQAPAALFELNGTPRRIGTRS